MPSWLAPVYSPLCVSSPHALRGLRGLVLASPASSPSVSGTFVAHFLFSVDPFLLPFFSSCFCISFLHFLFCFCFSARVFPFFFFFLVPTVTIWLHSSSFSLSRYLHHHSHAFRRSPPTNLQPSQRRLHNDPWAPHHVSRRAACDRHQAGAGHAGLRRRHVLIRAARISARIPTRPSGTARPHHCS